MEKYISSDKPIASKDEDKFQRYNFSSRIAKAILDRKGEDCITIGIYGAWGEGKTSVLNFIEGELRADKEFVIVKFNPWRYIDENSLLVQFFNKLASVLDANLKNKERTGDLLNKYGKLLTIDLPVVGNLAEGIQSAGSLLGDVDVETLKSRISDIIKENNKRLVIFIDDIDRLDKNEIHSIFRLVKLTADFSYTTYILSFDEQMVAAAIGERFGEGNEKSGRSFLEKIIQVPLQIPMAQQDALKSFCFKLIENAMNSNEVILDQNEINRFVELFSESILWKLYTPRLAVRYGNTLSFSFPMLYKEVNSVDLMLIEAVKVFYPEHYDFIKSNPEYFIGSYNERFSRNHDTQKANEFKEHLAHLSTGVTKKQAESIQTLLQELFPQLKGVFQNYFFSSENEVTWFKEKRICSTKYFNRYFTYDVIKGEVSDVAFRNLLDNVLREEQDRNIASVRWLIEQSSPGNFVQKIRTLEDELSWDVGAKLAMSIGKSSSLLPTKTNDYFQIGFGTPNSQAAIFIYKFAKRFHSYPAALDFIKAIIIECETFDFAFEVTKWFKKDEKEEGFGFTPEEVKSIDETLLIRAKAEAQDQTFFDKFPDQAKFLYSVWANEDPEGLSAFSKSFLDSDEENALKLLQSFTPTMTSTSHPAGYKSNFSKDTYNYLAAIFDKDIVKQYLFKCYSEATLQSGDINWEEHEGPYQSDLNIAKQFLHRDKESETVAGSQD